MISLIKKNVVKLFFVMLFISLLFMYSPSNTNTNSNDNMRPTNNDPLTFVEASSADFSNISDELSVNSFAYGENNSQLLHMWYNSSGSSILNDSSQIILPDGWSGYFLYVYVFEISENRCWVINPGFDGGTTSWDNSTNDVGGTNIINVTYDPNGHDTGDGAVEFFIDGRYSASNGFYYYDQGDTALINQTLSIPRGSVVWAGLSLDYSAWTDSTWGMTGMFRIFVDVEGTRVWGKSFDDISAESTWYSTGIIEVSPTIFNLPSDQVVDLRVGLEATQSVGYRPDIQPHAQVDNIYLYVMARAKPSDINLKMNGLTVLDTTGPNNEVYGYGNVTQIPSPAFTTSPVFGNFTWAPTPTPPNPNLDITVEMKVNMALNISYSSITYYDYDISKVGTRFDISNGSNGLWIFYVYVGVPTYYGDYYYNLTIPADWEIIHLGTPLNPSQNYINYTLGGKYGDRYFEVHVDNVTNSPNGFWYIKAQTPNYISEIWTQKYDSSSNTWINSTAFRVSNKTRILARIGGPFGLPTDVSSHRANLTILFPNGSLWYTELQYPNSTGYVVFSNITISGTNTTAGLYTYTVMWQNNTECGIKTHHFSVIHATYLSPRFTFYDSLFGDVIFAQVRYIDADTNEIITQAVVKSNWSTEIVTYAFVEQKGWYEGELNTTKLPEGGYYTVIVNATRDYYDPAQTNFTVRVVADTEIYSPESPSVLKPWGFNVTINVHYYRKLDNIGVDNANVFLNWTAGYYSYVYQGNGWYRIELNTTAKGLGDHPLNITLSKAGHKTQTIIIMIRLRFHDTFFYNDPVESVGYTDNITVYLHYTDLDTGQGITNESGKLNITVYSSVSFQHWIVENGSGIYTLWINASSLPNVGVIYTFNVNATWPGEPYYLNASLSFSVLVRGTRTQVIYDPLGQIPIGSTFNLTLYYIDVDTGKGIPNQTNSYGSHVRFTITSLNGSYVYELIEVGNGTYVVQINSSQFSTIGRYFFVFNFSWEGNYLPQYEDVNNTMISVVIRTRLTELLYTLPSTTIWGENITILVQYLDVDLDIPIYNATLTCDWPSYMVNKYSNGSYGLVLNTTTRDSGVYSLVISTNKTNYDLKQVTISIQLVKRNMALYTQTHSVSVVWGTTIYVSIYLNDSLNGIPIHDATVNYSWIGGNGTLTSANNGTYYGFISTSSAPTGIYVFTLTANRDNYQTVLGQISFSIQQVDTVLTTNTTTISLYYGENITVTVKYYDAVNNISLQNAYVTYSWEGGNGTLTEISPGIYSSNISTIDLAVGLYTIYVSASSTNYRTQVIQVSVDLIPRPAEITSYSGLVITVIWGQPINLNFTISDTLNGETLHNASITYNWPAGVGTIGEVGTTGNYSLNLDSKELTPGIYTLSVISSKVGYHSNVLDISIIVRSIPMSMSIDSVSIFDQNGTLVPPKLDFPVLFLNLTTPEVRVPIGDIVYIKLNLTDYYNSFVENATVTYRWEFAFGKLEWLGGGTYGFQIDTTLIPIGPYLFTISASEPYHESSTFKITLYVVLIPTKINATESLIINEFEVINITILYLDYWHGLGIENANVTMVIAGTDISFTVTELGNGYYRGILSEGLSEGLYKLVITAHKQNYQLANITITLSVRGGEGILSVIGPVGAVSGILALILAIGYIAYARYFSIPPLVRKINSLLSAIKKNKKLPILKGINARDALIYEALRPTYEPIADVVPEELLKDKLIYPIELVEIVAVEEEIKKDLEAIPGLSDEEKEKLLESLTKIPPKDRKWFLEDLKRQMIERGEMPPEETKEEAPEETKEEAPEETKEAEEEHKEE